MSVYNPYSQPSKHRKHLLQMLPEVQLNTLSTERLLAHLHSVRAVISSIETYYGERCCEMCHQYVGDDWKTDVAQYSYPFKVYKQLIKGILASRGHVARGKQGKPQYRKPSKARLRFSSKPKKNKKAFC